MVCVCIWRRVGIEMASSVFDQVNYLDEGDAGERGRETRRAFSRP